MKEPIKTYLMNEPVKSKLHTVWEDIIDSLPNRANGKHLFFRLCDVILLLSIFC